MQRRLQLIGDPLRSGAAGSIRFAVLMCIVSLILCATCHQARAQDCSAQWLEGSSVAGIDGTVYATAVWDPDGSGPRTPLVVYGGQFQRVGDKQFINLAAYDPSDGSWQSVGNGAIIGPVYSILPLPDGRLAIGGRSPFIAGRNPGFAIWDGSQFSGPTNSMIGTVYSLAIRGSEIIVAGDFWNTLPNFNKIGVWTGSEFLALGGGLGLALGNSVYAVAVLPSGDIVAAGDFWATTPAGQARGMARWDGLQWNPVPGVPGEIHTMVVSAEGDLVVGGTTYFLSDNPLVPDPCLARWDGTTWTRFDTDFSAVYGLTLAADGAIWAAGQIGHTPSGVSRWDGAHWVPVATANDTAEVRSLAFDSDGTLYIGGRFYRVNGAPAQNVARLDNDEWQALAAGTSGSVYAIVAAQNGRVYVGGDFASVDGTPANGVAEWDGSRWNALGSGADSVRGLALAPNGDLIIGGKFSSAGGVAANNIARWNGTQWSPLGNGVDGMVNTVTVTPAGWVFAGGSFHNAGGVPANSVAVWNGDSWGPWGDFNASVTCLIYDQYFGLYASGWFTMADGIPVNHVARWNGVFWSPLSDGISGFVYSLAVLPSGQVVAGTTSQYATGVPIWNGTAWTTVSLSSLNSANAFTVLPSGEFVVGGYLGSGNVLRRRASPPAWVTIGSPGLDKTVRALAIAANGELIVGGDFATAGGKPSAGIARYTFSPQPPTFTQQPADASPCRGDAVLFTAAYSGTTASQIAWSHNGQAIDPATNPSAKTLTLVINHASSAFGGEYRCTVTNICGSAITDPATLTVCDTDFACDGAVSVQDLFAFLDAWFAQFPDGVPGSPSADFDRSGDVAVADLFGYLDAWFTEFGVCGN